MEIVGYADRLSAAPGETVAFMVSTATIAIVPIIIRRVIAVLLGGATQHAPLWFDHKV